MVTQPAWLPDGVRRGPSPAPTPGRNQLQERVRTSGRWLGSDDWNGSWRSFLHPHFAEHAGFHVVKQVAMERPATQRVGAHAKGPLRTRRHVDGVLAHH